MDTPFRNRADGGRALASMLHEYRDRTDVVVLALPRGGVPVGLEVARELDAPLDVFIVRKLGVPGREELAMGAVASGGVRVLNDDVLAAAEISESQLDSVTQSELVELARRERDYRGDRPAIDIAGKTVLLIDDGVATGASIRAAAMAIRRRNPARIVIAVPVAAPESTGELRDAADEVISVLRPQPLMGVGRWYDDFSQVSDDEVRQCLAAADSLGTPPPRPPPTTL